MALTDNLIAFWELEEASGTRNDSHGANHLTDVNTVGQNTGKVGNCADFVDTNAEALTRTDNTDLSAGDIEFTIAAWVNFDAGGASTDVIVAKDTALSGEYYLTYSHSLARFRFEIYGSSGFGDLGVVAADSFGAASSGTWYFVVGWYNPTANTVNIQINNGTVDNVSQTVGIFDGTGTFQLAGDSFSDYWNGLIDQVGIWKRVLTSQERTDLYNGGAGLSYAAMSGPVARPFFTTIDARMI